MLIRSRGGQYEKRAIPGIGFGREKAHLGFSRYERCPVGVERIQVA